MDSKQKQGGEEIKLIRGIYLFICCLVCIWLWCSVCFYKRHSISKDDNSSLTMTQWKEVALLQQLTYGSIFGVLLCLAYTKLILGSKTIWGSFNVDFFRKKIKGVSSFPRMDKKETSFFLENCT